MGLNVENLYTFNGPFTRVDDLLAKSGVYLISILENGYHRVLDIGESENIYHRVKNHDRANQWVTHGRNQTLHVSSFYCDEPTRMTIERQLRATCNPVCGER
jgi:hypothetical protein